MKPNVVLQRKAVNSTLTECDSKTPKWSRQEGVSNHRTNTLDMTLKLCPHTTTLPRREKCSHPINCNQNFRLQKIEWDPGTEACHTVWNALRGEVAEPRVVEFHVVAVFVDWFGYRSPGSRIKQVVSFSGFMEAFVGSFKGMEGRPWREVWVPGIPTGISRYKKCPSKISRCSRYLSPCSSRTARCQKGWARNPGVKKCRGDILEPGIYFCDIWVPKIPNRYQKRSMNTKNVPYEYLNARNAPPEYLGVKNNSRK